MFLYICMYKYIHFRFICCIIVIYTLYLYQHICLILYMEFKHQDLNVWPKNPGFDGIHTFIS